MGDKPINRRSIGHFDARRSASFPARLHAQHGRDNRNNIVSQYGTIICDGDLTDPNLALFGSPYSRQVDNPNLFGKGLQLASDTSGWGVVWTNPSGIITYDNYDVFGAWVWLSYATFSSDDYLALQFRNSSSGGVQEIRFYMNDGLLPGWNCLWGMPWNVNNKIIGYHPSREIFRTQGSVIDLTSDGCDQIRLVLGDSNGTPNGWPLSSWGEDGDYKCIFGGFTLNRKKNPSTIFYFDDGIDGPLDQQNSAVSASDPDYNKTVVEKLNEHDHKACFGIIANAIIIELGTAFTWQQLQTLYDQGHELSVHSTHYWSNLTAGVDFPQGWRDSLTNPSGTTARMVMKTGAPHGLSGDGTITVSAATPAGYNATDVAYTVIDAHTIDYDCGSSGLADASVVGDLVTSWGTGVLTTYDDYVACRTHLLADINRNQDFLLDPNSYIGAIPAGTSWSRGAYHAVFPGNGYRNGGEEWMRVLFSILLELGIKTSRTSTPEICQAISNRDYENGGYNHLRTIAGLIVESDGGTIDTYTHLVDRQLKHTVRYTGSTMALIMHDIVTGGSQGSPPNDTQYYIEDFMALVNEIAGEQKDYGHVVTTPSKLSRDVNANTSGLDFTENCPDATDAQKAALRQFAEDLASFGALEGMADFWIGCSGFDYNEIGIITGDACTLHANIGHNANGYDLSGRDGAGQLVDTGFNPTDESVDASNYAFGVFVYDGTPIGIAEFATEQMFECSSAANARWRVTFEAKSLGETEYCMNTNAARLVSTEIDYATEVMDKKFYMCRRQNPASTSRTDAFVNGFNIESGDAAVNGVPNDTVKLGSTSFGGTQSTPTISFAFVSKDGITMDGPMMYAAVLKLLRGFGVSV